MRTPNAVRQQRVRRRRRLGLRAVHVEISEEAIELLETRGYLQSRTPASMGLAIHGAAIGFGPGRGLVPARRPSLRPFPHTAHAGVPRRKQEGKLFELRAAISLARLWCIQHKRAEARDVLAPIYSWFSSGFDMPDLIAAKALLNELASLNPQGSP